MRYAYQPVPGMTEVDMLNSEALVWGGIQASAGSAFNQTLVSYPTSLFNSSQHPGFDIKPITNNWCTNPNNDTPMSAFVFFASTSAALTASLQQVSTTAESDPHASAITLTFFPYVSGVVIRTPSWGRGSVGSRARASALPRARARTT